MGWYNEVKNDSSKIYEAISYFDDECDKARKETSLKGDLTRVSRDIPGIIAYRFSQLQEIEAILEYLNIETRKMHREHFRKYLENHSRALSSRDAEKYAEGEADVIDMCHLVNEFALVRNKWLGVIKGLESKQFQINNLTKLYTSGMEDISL